MRLTVAIVRRGIDAVVHERAPRLGEIGAGAFITPNSVRSTERMRLGEALATFGARVGAGCQDPTYPGCTVELCC